MPVPSSASSPERTIERTIECTTEPRPTPPAGVDAPPPTSAAGPAPVRTRLPAEWRIALALALLLGLQPISTDVYLPALPLLPQALGAGVPAVQLTMSALILAFGLAQLVWGPVADRFGRRPVLLTGLALYGAASIAAAAAGGITILVAARALQGAALAAAVVCARAVVRDLYEPAQGAGVMARAMGGLGVMALLGPLAGGFAAAAFGWRGPLVLVAVVGGAVLLHTAWALPETLPRRNLLALQPGPLLRTWGDMLRHPVFRAWTLLVSAAYGGLFTVLAASSFTYMGVLGLSAPAYGAAMALGSASYIAGTLVCRRWIVRHGMAGTVWRGGFFTLAGGLGMALPALVGHVSLPALLVPQCLFVFGHGMHQPCAQAGVTGPFPHSAGAAAALAGALLAGVAFAVGLGVGATLDASTRTISFGLAAFAALTCFAAWRALPRAIARDARSPQPERA